MYSTFNLEEYRLCAETVRLDTTTIYNHDTKVMTTYKMTYFSMTKDVL